jgi:hypothetical protein
MLTIHRGHIVQAGDGVDTVQIPSTSIVEIKWIPHTMMTNGSVTVSFMLPDGSIHNEPDKLHALENSPYRLVFHRGQEDGARNIVEAVNADISSSPIPLPAELEVHPKTPVTLKDINSSTVFVGADHTRIILHEHTISKFQETYPLAGVQIHLENGTELQSRVTATRLLALGVFALAAKKKSGGEKYLKIEGPDFSWVIKVSADQVDRAMRFMSLVQSSVKRESSEDTSEAPKSTNMDIEHLASLHDQGILTDEEFSAAKAKALGI